ncbi:MAG TPA: OmpA family protein [Oligoflexus sp.]|uniref:OmpA family protein n=1 Tax=Oligoflexus sp. TaxID=1971216 RepID=UPI002D7E89E8|nr:OmpA family protein [Oligoflexus sp.]HET9238982.1 OmpA family protein [Oligoflexus sp.]
MKMKLMLSALVVLNLFAVACTNDDKKVEEVVATEKKADDHEFSVDKDGKLEFKAEIVYFAFDDASLTPEGMARLDAIAAHMKTNTKEKLKVEGHCDDRGSIEYNLALGQRRAESVRKYLETVGIGADRLQAVSFGSEKPAVAGQGEEAWSKNRRAEFAFAQ